MKTKLLQLLILSCIIGCVEAPPKTFNTNHDWTEPIDPKKTDISTWDSITKPFATFGSIDMRYPRSAPFKTEAIQTQSISGWKGEKVHAQIIVCTNEEIKDLWCKVDDFKNSNGDRLRDVSKARFVKYVLSDIPYEKATCRVPAEETVHLQPDMLDETPYLTIPAKTVRPIWITIDIPQNATKGEYTAKIRLRGEKFKENLSLTLNVIDRTLPKASEWNFHLDLWQHPSAIARIGNVTPWSDEHYNLMRPIMSLLASAGQKVITATVNKDPWNNQCFDSYEDMIIWNKYPDGSWEYDFAIFDQWVEFMMDLGINKMINCYSMLPWNNMLHYRDVATGKFIDVKADPGTKEFKEMWIPFIQAFEQHLSEKGWLDITNIAMDERSPEYMTEAVTIKNEYAPRLGIALADNHSIFKKYPFIKDMCAGIFAPIEHDDICKRREQGLITTYYVCCSSVFPNTYTSSSPAEAVYLGWYAAAHDYDGFLRWAYNSWPQDPIRDSRFRTWAGGDTYLVYPEGYSSIRFERLIEGIQDWEKIKIIRNECRNDTVKLHKLETLIDKFKSGEPFEFWENKLKEAQQLLNQI